MEGDTCTRRKGGLLTLQSLREGHRHRGECGLGSVDADRLASLVECDTEDLVRRVGHGIEIQDDTHGALVELRVFHVGDAGARDAIVGTRDSERRAPEIEHDAVGRAQCEIANLHIACNADHNLRLTGDWNDTEGSDRPVNQSGRGRQGAATQCDRRSCDDCQDWLHLILVFDVSAKNSES